MKYVYIALIVALAIIVGLFKIQNVELVTLSLLSASLTIPVWVLVVLVYVLGMATGSLVFALLRNLVRGARAA